MPNSVPHDDHNALPVGLRLGEFEIRRVLGSGGFGIVYVAFDRALEREVAIKEYMPTSLAGRSDTHHVTVLSRSNTETFALGLRSFVNEAKLLARFDHPSLVKVLRFWEEHGTAYMAMPFYKGSTLKALRQGANSTPDEAWLRKVCESLLGALEAMHKEGVFHRDISPDNIVVDEDGRPVLLDFGAARRVINDKSQALTAILKPNYAPIEQYAESPGLRQGPWTDIYALGATLHFLVTGQPPMPATARALNDQRVPLQHLSIEGLSKPLLALIDWMLAPRPEHRPRDVAQVRAALAGRLEVPAAPLPVPPAAEDDGDWPQTQVFERTLPPQAGAARPAADGPGDEEDDPDATIVRPASWRPVALAQAPVGSAPPAPGAASAAAPAAVPAPPPAPEPAAPPPARPAASARPEAAPEAPDDAVAVRPRRAALPWWLGGAALVAAAAVYLVAGHKPDAAPPGPAASAVASASAPAMAASAGMASAPEAVTVIGALPPASAAASAPVAPALPAAPLPSPPPVVAAPAPVAPAAPVASAPAVSAAEARAAAASAAAAARLARTAASKPQPGNPRNAQAGSAASVAAAAAPAPAPSAATALPQPTPRAVVVAAPAAPAEPERRDPNEACGGKMLIALHRCLMRECVKPEFTQHAACARAREVERRTQESLGNN